MKLNKGVDHSKRSVTTIRVLVGKTKRRSPKKLAFNLTFGAYFFAKKEPFSVLWFFTILMIQFALLRRTAFYTRSHYVGLGLMRRELFSNQMLLSWSWSDVLGTFFISNGLILVLV